MCVCGGGGGGGVGGGGERQRACWPVPSKIIMEGLPPLLRLCNTLFLS